MTANNRDWATATKANPCPACGATKWCMHGPGGGLCNHDQVPDGCHDGGEQAGGGRLWWYDAPAAPDDADARPVVRPTKPAGPKRGTPEEMGQVYARLLVLCPLTSEHRDHLSTERRLSPEEIDTARLASLPYGSALRKVVDTLTDEFGDLLLQIPGFKTAKAGNIQIVAAGSGILLPIYIGEQVTAMRLRLDDARPGDRYRWMSGGGGPSIEQAAYVVNPVEMAPGVAIVTEGEFKAITAAKHRGCLAIGVPGVTSYRLALPVLGEHDIETVHLAADADHQTNPNVYRPTAAAVELLRAEGYDVRLLLWDDSSKGIDDAIHAGIEITELHGDDIDAHLARVGVSLGIAAPVVEETLSKVIETAGRKDNNDDRPTVQIWKNDLRAQKRALSAELALIEPPPLYERQGAVTTIDDHRLTRPSVGALRSDLDELFRFFVMQDDEEQTIIPPHTILETLHCRPAHFGLPRLTDFVTAPVILRDGTVTDVPGYYPDHLAYYSGEILCDDVPTNPTAEQVSEAVSLIDTALQDFPFLERDKTNFFALLLAMVGRDVIDGLVPPFMVSANTPGTGKGLLSEVAARMTTGRQASTSTWKSDGEEMRKFITSSLLAGERLVVLDNVNDTMDSDIFAAATTSRVWTDRALGGNAILRLENRAIFLATANNPTMSAEVSRRFVTVELATDCENPHERRGFAIPNLLRWVDDRAPDILAALLTLWRAWFSADKPLWKGQALGSYDDFSEIVGGVLSVAGVDGFLSNRQRVRDDVDTETSAWRAFVGEWYRCYRDEPVSSAQLHALCLVENPEEEHAYMRAPRPDPLLLQVLGAGNERSQASKLGRALSAMRNRVFGLHKVHRDETKWNGLTRYRLSPVPLAKDLISQSEERSPLSPIVPYESQEPNNRNDLSLGDFKGTSVQSPLNYSSSNEFKGTSDHSPLDSPLEKNPTTTTFEDSLGDYRTKGTSPAPGNPAPPIEQKNEPEPDLPTPKKHKRSFL